jgi:hypothetical protein
MLPETYGIVPGDELQEAALERLLQHKVVVASKLLFVLG